MRARCKGWLWEIIPGINTVNWDTVNFTNSNTAFIIGGELYFPEALFHDIMYLYYENNAILLNVLSINESYRFFMYNVDFKKFISDLYILIIKDELDGREI